MITLRIDGVDVPLATQDVELPTYNAKCLRSCQAQREGDVIMLSVKATDATSRLFGFAECAFVGEVFNSSYHYGELLVDRVVLLSGVVTYLSTKEYEGDRVYNIKIASGGAEWADRAATTKLRELPINASRLVELSSIWQSWTDDNPIKMLPLNRDSYPVADNTGLYEVYHPKLPQDYHPFISVKALINNILSGDGSYCIKSRFLDSAFFEKLMMSGSYKGMLADVAYATMGFNAVRLASSAARADILGRVDVSLPMQENNIGAFVDTVSPTTIDESGQVCEGAYSNGGCFTFDNALPLFRPKRDVDVAFDMHFCYTTDYKMISSKRLQGFTNLYVGNGCYVDIPLPNPHIDRRNSVKLGMRYKLVIFDYNPSTSYRLAGVGDVNGRVSTVQFSSLPAKVRLFKRDAGTSNHVEYTGDWALYDGYVSETGTQRVEFTIRTPYERCTPTSPKVFNDIYFSGAEEGQQLTLHAGCSITPHFGGTAGYGERITFEDVANHDITAQDIVDAIVQMFNLCIYTHKPSRTIFVEPYDDFFSGEVVDWRDRQRDGKTLYSECVVDSFMTTQLGYQPSDGAVGHCYDSDSGEFGAWRHHTASYATKQSVASRLNLLFHPTASMSTLVGTAPSASVMVVGDRESVEEEVYIEPRIVLYYGVQKLPVGEYWPAPYDEGSYPLAEFHSVVKGETLCFEDRDGIIGLHRYYDNELRECATCQVLTTDIYLPPEQYASLLDPNSCGANLRSRFRLNVQGSSALFRLDAIEGYDDKRCIVRCRFQRLCEE